MIAVGAARKNELKKDTLADWTMACPQARAGPYFNNDDAWLIERWLNCIWPVAFRQTDLGLLAYKFRKDADRTMRGKLIAIFPWAVSERAKNSMRQIIRLWRIHSWSEA